MTRRALVSQMRVPEIDRDSGSQRADLYVKWLLRAGWSVTFVAGDDQSEDRHRNRLAQLGVPTHIGFDRLEELLEHGDFDLALLGFWEPASRVLPLIRELSPRTRTVVDSIDLHFLREGRQALRAGASLEAAYGERLVGELNTYQAADAVLAVSDKEAGLLADFLGEDRTWVLHDARDLERSRSPFEERRGMLFIGNFRHLPNGEAVEHLCRDILPRIDRDLLAEHPLSVVGSRLDDKVIAHARGIENVRMVGWVPSVLPYLESVRVSAVPLLHGAGVKGKIIESLMIGTPVVTTPIGAEGMELVDGDNAVVATDPDDLAAGLTRMLTDEAAWQKLADAGRDLACEMHGAELIRERFLKIVEHVMTRPVRLAPTLVGAGRRRRRELAYREVVGAASRTLDQITAPGATVLVVSRGDENLLSLRGRTGWHFPRVADGRWAGHHPADSDAAIRHLEALRNEGAAYLAIPSPSFWWLNHYRALTDHLDSRYRRIHSSRHLIVFDVGEGIARQDAPSLESTRRERVAVLGTHPEDGPPPERLIAALAECENYDVHQSWTTAELTEAAEEADWIVRVSDVAEVPAGFLDDFLGAASGLLPLGPVRFQPAHESGPSAGPPVTERLRGVLGRELSAVTPLPILATRGDAEPTGPTTLIDAVPITLARTLGDAADAMSFSDVADVFSAGPDAPARLVRRSGSSMSPVLSVLVSTYDRPELLAGCLQGFCDQDLPVADFEVVVVDDGSGDERTSAVLAGFADRLPLTWARIEHAGRSAAKNLAVMLASGELVLFFDDDDVPAPDLLSEHVRAHVANPGEASAVLGYTGWDPAIPVSPLMHFVTDVEKLLFSYDNLSEDASLDWRGFWEGRISSKRSLHLRHALHDQRLAYSIDIEMAWRLARHGLEVSYHPGARSVMARSVDLEGFCRRQEAKGRAQAAIAALHDDPELAAYLKIEGAAERWEQARSELATTMARIRELESAIAAAGPTSAAEGERLDELHRCYRFVIAAHNAKGIAEELGGLPSRPDEAPPRHEEPAGEDEPPIRPSESARRRGTAVNGSKGDPVLTVTMPVWSRTPELAAMAVETIDRVWEVARLPTEVVVIDNGSAFPHPGLEARVQRFEENRGVASGWNAGIELARAPVIAVLNSDCRVEPGWDEALYEAATDGRRIAFPYTDHCDGKGFRRPDQAGTAGWCFMLTSRLREEIGWFDERFNPAYVEDTDYWHRAWELGIELSPVPQARVTHARRTSASDRSDWLLTGHRYLYGWKHGVEPMRAPPFYNREIIDYQSRRGSVRLASAAEQAESSGRS